MIKETVKYPSFSETDFIRLYCAMNVKKKCSRVISHHELEKRLYEYYSLPEFVDLFQDICPKKDNIYPENSYMDLSDALQKAQLLGVLTLIHDATTKTKSIIAYNIEEAEEVITNANQDMVEKMANLFDRMDNRDSESKQKEETELNNSSNTDVTTPSSLSEEKSYRLRFPSSKM